MNCKEIAELFKRKPYYLRMGNVNIARRLNTLPEEVIKARKIYRASPEQSPRYPKILILDIETAPLRAFVFNMWNQNITIDKIISDWYCLCWSAKWLFEENIYSDRLSPEEARSENDCRILLNLKGLLDEADIVVSHNGDKFDLPRINTRFLLNNIPTPTPYQSVDTYKVVRNQFSFASNKLDFLATKFGFPNKIETTFELWSRCVDGEEEALIAMERYNKYDVELLENVYLRLRPYIKNHPNVALYMEATERVCPNCGSKHISLEGSYYTNTNKYELYRCECGTLSRARLAVTPKKIKENLLINNIR